MMYGGSRERYVEKFKVGKGVSQGCPLSPLLFSILFVDLEEQMRKEQEGEWVIGRRKI